MKMIYINIKAFSDVDVINAGVYRYVESQEFELLLLSYSIDGGEVQVVNVAGGEIIPEAILRALTDNSILKYAYNATFVRICLSKYLRRNYHHYFKSYNISEDNSGGYLDPSAWRCIMISAAYNGLPFSFKSVCEIMNLEIRKMNDVSALERYFCVPDYNSVRHYPAESSGKWEEFKRHTMRELELVIDLHKKLLRFPVPETVWDEYHLGEKINDRGILIDLTMVEQAIRFGEFARASILEKLQQLTNLENPKSVQQMKQWLSEHGVNTSLLDRSTVQHLIKSVPVEIQKVLLLYQQISKSSLSKYETMKNVACFDSRARGMFQFYGASRSGRFSSRHLQFHNLPQNHISNLSEARDLLKKGDYNALKCIYNDTIQDILAQLIRTAFIPREGYRFIVADFNAIEARVIAWLAGEQWRMDAFANGEDIYCASASKMFGVPVEKHGINGHLRQKGKIAELACGYGGSVGAMKAMGGDELNLSDEELKRIVDDWRKSSPYITTLWWAVDDAVKSAIKYKTTTETHGLRFIYQSRILFIELPSKRRLAYAQPAIVKNRFGGESVTYMGTGKNQKWECIESYGSKLVENIVQGIARDLLCNSIRMLSDCFIVAHVHDEVIIEADSRVSLQTVRKKMSRSPPWAKGLLLQAEAYECEYYQKE
ncbi:DNA polymerase [Ruminococcus flavefaciens]|uniref:DNA polymerase n=1 Tax=Ruminococcus flavefaciens TaxID=1265 RepID=UPI0004634D28|nr:DNA polymerase [Ruminococcus flavefaciens]